MVQAIKEASDYAKSFRTYQEERAGTDPSWLRRLRDAAFASFEETGFPTTSEEDWKYTNVGPISKTTFGLPSEREEDQSIGTDSGAFGYGEARDSQLVFVNGTYRSDLSSVSALPDGVVVVDFREALNNAHHSEVVRRQLARSADHNRNGFVALNTAFLGSGAFIQVPKGVAVESPIHVLFISEGSECRSAPRILIVSEMGSSATVIESYECEGDEDVYFTNAVVEIVLEEGARLNHYRVQRESLAAFHIAATEARLARNSSYNATAITFGARLSRHEINVLFEESGAECWVDGLYIVGTGQHADTHSLIDHRHPHCTSHQLYKGIMDGKSRAVFNGKVFVRPGAQQTDAKQTNKNLLLSNEARVDTKPQLEIFADDVKCAHGAAIGQIDEDELFYLETRGIPTEVARNLLTYGFAEEVIGKIKIDSIRTQLDEAVLNRLHAELEV